MGNVENMEGVNTMRFVAGNRAFETYEQAANYCTSSDWDLDIIKAEEE
jgi:hypothetical protein